MTGRSQSSRLTDSRLADSLTTVGRIGSVYGVQGWVRIQSFTSPPDNLLGYQPWWLKTRHGVKPVELEDSKPHGAGLIAKLAGIDDRESAKLLARVDIAVEASQFPALEPGDYYWHQLQGLQVVTCYQGQTRVLGEVKRLLETGANDVLVVQGDGTTSLDTRERLIPYLPGQVVKSVDLQQQTISVDWDPAF